MCSQGGVRGQVTARTDGSHLPGAPLLPCSTEADQALHPRRPAPSGHTTCQPHRPEPKQGSPRENHVHDFGRRALCDIRDSQKPAPGTWAAPRGVPGFIFPAFLFFCFKKKPCAATGSVPDSQKTPVFLFFVK
jgi:hypothetical protein